MHDLIPFEVDSLFCELSRLPRDRQMADRLLPTVTFHHVGVSGTRTGARRSACRAVNPARLSSWCLTGCCGPESQSELLLVQKSRGSVGGGLGAKPIQFLVIRQHQT